MHSKHIGDWLRERPPAGWAPPRVPVRKRTAALSKAVRESYAFLLGEELEAKRAALDRRYSAARAGTGWRR